ncbi:hypothetical protein TNCV_3588971 [Trichonephila clavipes]|nr:hypothetical protein TNCV_3588971 [Trichonephila clavipes]
MHICELGVRKTFHTPLRAMTTQMTAAMQERNGQGVSSSYDAFKDMSSIGSDVNLISAVLSLKRGVEVWNVWFEITSWYGAGLVRPSLRVRPLPKSLDFHDAKNRQRPCRMIMRHVKGPKRARLVWVLQGKIKFLVQFRIVRAQVSPSGVETWKCSLVIKVTDSLPRCHEFEPSSAEDPPYRKGRWTLNMSRLKLPLVWWGVEVRREFPAEVSSSSLDHG